MELLVAAALLAFTRISISNTKDIDALKKNLQNFVSNLEQYIWRHNCGVFANKSQATGTFKAWNTLQRFPV